MFIVLLWIPFAGRENSDRIEKFINSGQKVIAVLGTISHFMEHFVRHECCHGPTNLMITRLSTLATTIEAITILKNDTQS